MPAPSKKDKPVEPEAVEAAPDEAAPSSSGAAEAEPEPMNRAERRAKGKKHGHVQQFGGGKAVRSTGPAAGPRMWANRRSG